MGLEILREGDDILGIHWNDTDLEIEDILNDTILVEASLLQVGDAPVDELVEDITIHIFSETGFGTYLFYEVTLTRVDEGPLATFVCHQPNKYWEGKWGLATFLQAIIDVLPASERFNLEDKELEDDWKRLEVSTVLALGGTVSEAVGEAAKCLAQVMRQAGVALGGLPWKREYEQDEKMFCSEVLIPLFRRMGFMSVRYRHGTKEYGKDITFSEQTSFGSYRHYGVQAKVGDISGEASAQIDDILGQLSDAFSMPYWELGSKEARYISTFIIAISGHFTENAREKIAEKVPKGVLGSVYFLDREAIQELVVRYWGPK